MGPTSSTSEMSEEEIRSPTSKWQIYLFITFRVCTKRKSPLTTVTQSLGGGRDDSSFSITHRKSSWLGSHRGFSDGEKVGHRVCVPLLIYDCTPSPSVLLTRRANTRSAADTPGLFPS